MNEKSERSFGDDFFPLSGCIIKCKCVNNVLFIENPYEII